MNATLFRVKLKAKSLLSRAFTRYVGDSCRALLVETKHAKLLVPSSDLSLARSLSLTHAYNEPLLNVILNEIELDSHVLFVGTHIGSLLIPTSKKCKTVVGIEANPFTFQLLEENLIINKCDNITLYNGAAYNQSGHLPFLASRDNTGGSKVQSGLKKTYEFEYDHPQTIQVKAHRLDDLLVDSAFDLIVMDIEGSEFFALQGMPNILFRSKKLIIEVHPLSIEKAANISPFQFFSILSTYFRTAQVLGDFPHQKHFSKGNFHDMYPHIQKHYRSSGVDVLFQK